MGMRRAGRVAQSLVKAPRGTISLVAAI